MMMLARDRAQMRYAERDMLLLFRRQTCRRVRVFLTLRYFDTTRYAAIITPHCFIRCFIAAEITLRAAIDAGYGAMMRDVARCCCCARERGYAPCRVTPLQARFVSICAIILRATPRYMPMPTAPPPPLLPPTPDSHYVIVTPRLPRYAIRR